MGSGDADFLLVPTAPEPGYGRVSRAGSFPLGGAGSADYVAQYKAAWGSILSTSFELISGGWTLRQLFPVVIEYIDSVVRERTQATLLNYHSMRKKRSDNQQTRFLTKSPFAIGPYYRPLLT